jgi:hypothetical protein
MLLTPRDKRKVLRRVQAETDGLFAACLPISLVLARDAEDDLELWEESGAESFVTTFLRIIGGLKDVLGADALAEGMPQMKPVYLPQVEPEAEAITEEPVMPRRPVVQATGARRQRPSAPEAEDP